MPVPSEGLFTRQVRFYPAYDYRHGKDGDGKNYGVHGVNLFFILRSLKAGVAVGAVHFTVFTNWQLPHVEKEQDARPVTTLYPHLFCHPQPADVGYHSLVPLRDWQGVGEGQSGPRAECEWLDGKPCYGSGSGLHAEQVYNLLVADGDEAVWQHLEEYYKEVFGGGG